MIHASDLSPAVRAKLGILDKPKKGRPKQDESANREFMVQCQALKLPPMLAQWRFTNSEHPYTAARRWRCDFVIKEYRLMIEIDGGIFIRGAHGHPTDILRNMRKQNDAMLLGFTVLRFTPSEVRNGHAVAFTQKVLTEKGWNR